MVGVPYERRATNHHTVARSSTTAGATDAWFIVSTVTGDDWGRTQNGRVPHRERLWTAALPNRTLRLTAGWTHRVDPGDGPVRVSVRP